MSNQDRLLSDEELRIAVNGSYLHRNPTEKMLHLINTQKRLYAESVINGDYMSKPNEITLDIFFTKSELEEMLKNATAGGLVQAKVQVEIKAEGVISEVILR